MREESMFRGSKINIHKTLFYLRRHVLLTHTAINIILKEVNKIILTVVYNGEQMT
jgi:hypothetical protein